MAIDGANSYEFPAGLKSIKGIATDGVNLYLQRAINNLNYPYSVVFGIASLGALK